MVINNKGEIIILFIDHFRVANILCGPCKLEKGERFLVILGKLPAWWLISIAAIRAGN